MVYITGDTHGEIERFSKKYIPFEDKLTEKDTIIVTGDFQFIFRGDEKEEENLDYLAGKRYEICFIDGNHENFPRLFSYPTVDYRSGKAGEIRKNIHYLRRGEIYEIEGKRYFTFGGAFSLNSPYLTTGVDHFTEEVPVDADYENADFNLKKANYSVDYIITHQAPTSLLRALGHEPHPADARLDDYLQWVKENAEFEKWYFGHWHDDRRLDEKSYLIWFSITEAGKFPE